MPLTEEQVREFFRQGIAQGIPKEELIDTVRKQNEAPSPPTNGGGGLNLALTDAFAEGAPIVPTESMPGVPDVGFFGDFLPSRIKRSVGVPIAGLLETAKLVGPGTMEEMRSGAEQTMVDYLAGDPGIWRTVWAGLTDIGAEMIPLTPGGAIGKQVTKRIGGTAGKLLAGATAGAAEGAVVGIGETVGMDWDERLKRGALMAGAGAGMGVLGTRALRQLRTDPKAAIAGTKGTEHMDKYFADGPVKNEYGIRDKLRQQWFNKERSLEKVVEDIDAWAAENHGKPLTARDKEDLALLVQEARTANRLANSPITMGTMDADGVITGKPLDDILPLDDGLHRDTLRYGAARRHLELKARRDEAREILPGLKEELKQAKLEGDVDAISALEIAIKDYTRAANKVISKKATNESIQALEVFGRPENYGINPKTGEVAVLEENLNELTAFLNRAVLDPLADPSVGVFDRATLDTMKRAGEHFVPFHRLVDEIDRLEIDSLLEPSSTGLGSAPIVGRMAKRGLDEREGLRIVDFYQEAGDRAIRVAAFAKKQRLRNALADLADEYPEALSGEVRKVKNPQKGGTFRVWRDGKQFGYAARDELLEAVETLDFRQANWVMRSARTMTNIFRAGATLTLDFAFGNFFRDLFTGGVYSREGLVPLVSVSRTMAEEMSHLLRNKGISSPEWKEFLRQSGAHATLVEGDRYDFLQHRQILKKRPLSGAKAGRLRTLMHETRTNPLAPFQATSSMLERVNRFAEFKRVRAAELKKIPKGLSPEAKAKAEARASRVAGMASADVTLNFSRGGSIGRRVNLYYAFSNAMLQDVSKFSRAMAERPFETSLRSLGYITAPSMYFWAKNQGDPDYENLPEWEKALFIHIGKMDNGKFVRIPMPPGILSLMFHYLPRKMADHFFNGDPNAMRELAGEFVDQSPLRYAPLPAGLNPTEDAFLNLMPDAVKPIAEIAANRVPFFDRPVISRRFENLPPAEQKSWRTSDLAKGVAGLGNALGIPLSPIEVDHLFVGYGAGIGRMVTGFSGSDSTINKMQDDGIFDMPGLRRFLSVSPYGFSSQPVQDFYNFVDKVDESAAGLKVQSNERRRKNFLDAHPEALYKKQANKVRQTLREFSEWRNRVQSDKTMDDMERRDTLLKIDQEVTRYTGEMMKMFYDAIQVDKAIAQGGKSNATP